MVELYKKYRPISFKEVVGQDAALRPLIELGRKNALPHAILLTGPSGTGKTTVARILRNKLKCSDMDFSEVNAAQERGIDLVRSIERRASLRPIDGECRIWLCDESHAMTSSAQGAFLKLLEDTPPHVYFFLATTDPQKLLATIRTRCTRIDLKPLKASEMIGLLKRVVEAEETTVAEDVLDKIVEYSDGSARKALVLLNQVIGMEDEEKALAAVSASVGEAQGIELARLLIKPRVRWPEVAAKLKELKTAEEDPEGLRYLILAYCNTVLLGGGALAKTAHQVMVCFERNFWDTKWAGLSIACWDAVCGE